MRIVSIASILSILSAALLSASPAAAALQKFRLNRVGIGSGPNVTPNPDPIAHGMTGPGIEPDSVVLVNSFAGPNPRLVKINDITDRTVTVLVPGLQTNIFVSVNQREGAGTAIFGSGGGSSPVFTGSGNTATQIRWGTITGWTVSGRWWCNSAPAIVCSLAMLIDQQTTQARYNSAFYDLGTWNFHGTGFRSLPFIHSYNTNDFGNFEWQYQGSTRRDGTVPALPIVGLTLLGGGLLVGGVAAMRRRGADADRRFDAADSNSDVRSKAS